MVNAAVKADNNYTLKIVHDEDSIDPREDYDNFGKMACWHSRYNLGDKHDYHSPGAFLAGIVRGTIPEKDIIAYVKDGKADGLKLVYDKSSREWELQSYDSYFKKWYEAGSYPPLLEKESGDLCDSILDNMASKDLMALAERKHIILPLYLLDHSGLSISTRDFMDRWDSGQIGWTYASHDDVIKEYGSVSPENLEKAEKLLESEVKTYDYYLHIECYGFMLYMNGEMQDSCWGFLGSFDDAKKAIRSYLPEDAVALMNDAEYGDEDDEYKPEYDSSEDEADNGTEDGQQDDAMEMEDDD